MKPTSLIPEGNANPAEIHYILGVVFHLKTGLWQKFQHKYIIKNKKE
jgi:hypothetical protein